MYDIKKLNINYYVSLLKSYKFLDGQIYLHVQVISTSFRKSFKPQAREIITVNVAVRLACAIQQWLCCHKSIVMLAFIMKYKSISSPKAIYLYIHSTYVNHNYNVYRMLCAIYINHSHNFDTYDFFYLKFQNLDPRKLQQSNRAVVIFE